MEGHCNQSQLLRQIHAYVVYTKENPFQNRFSMNEREVERERERKTKSATYK